MPGPRLGPAPQDFRDFVQGEWEDLGGDRGCPATVTVDRYSHLGFASGNLGSCGGYMALWAKDGGGRQEVFGYQEGPYCASMSDRAQEAITAPGIECLPSSEAVQGVLLGTEWPASGGECVCDSNCLRPHPTLGQTPPSFKQGAPWARPRNVDNAGKGRVSSRRRRPPDLCRSRPDTPTPGQAGGPSRCYRRYSVRRRRSRAGPSRCRWTSTHAPWRL